VRADIETPNPQGNGRDIMGVRTFDEARDHVGHDIECVIYGEQNVSVECITCGVVLVDFEKEE